MIRIGEFANIFNVSIKTIRLYDEMGLLTPCKVDIYTGYRYYNDENIKEMTKILFLKDLGLSLKEIKTFDFNDYKIQEKIKEYEHQLIKIENNINTLKALSQKEVIQMKTFINDEQAIGKWKLLGVSQNEEKAKNKEFIEDDFQINELYLMPKGEEYWVISWTKGSIFIKEMSCPYNIEENLMYVKINDPDDNSFYKIALYEKVDSKEYTEEEIRIKDNTDLPFIKDENLIGTWKSIDFVKSVKTFNPQEKYIEKYFKGNLFLDKITITNDNDCIATFNKKDKKVSENIKYTKGYIFDLCWPFTSSSYEFIEKDNKKYLLIEWKSGDYVYANMINGYYCLEKIN